MKNQIKNKISVVLGSYNRLNFLKLTIDSIREELKDFVHEIIVVDGGSDDGALRWLTQQKDIITIVQHNRGKWQGKKIESRSWGYFMNLGFKCVQGKYICMLSDDCLIIPGAIKNGYRLFEKKLSEGRKIGAVAFYFRDWSKQEQYHVGCTLGNKLYVNHGIYLKKAVQDVGYIDEDTFFFYNADGDLCLKMWKKRYECIDSPNSFVEHYPHANVKVINSNHKKQRQDDTAYFRKWEGIFYDKNKKNRGKIILKEYYDLTKTGEKFLNLHKKVIKSFPQVLKGKSAYKKVADFFIWKYRAFTRKFWQKFS